MSGCAIDWKTVDTVPLDKRVLIHFKSWTVNAQVAYTSWHSLTAWGKENATHWADINLPQEESNRVGE